MDKQEAIKILKEFHDTSALFSVRTALETVFPELKEGEDEKIRKTLIEYFNAYPKEYFGGLKKRYIVAWLEKQGEQKHLDYENANIQQKDFAPKAATANRQLYNRAILAILSNYVEKYPDTRFGQMLYNLGVNPHFNEESRETYCNLNETINNLL